MAASDPPSPALLELLHYLEDEYGFRRSYPKTTSDAAKILWFFIKRLRGLPAVWPVPIPQGRAVFTGPGVEVAGVTSLQPDALAVLTGAIQLLSGSGVTLSESGQTITITALDAPVVDSLAKSGDTPLTGNVTLSAGSNVTLTESGNDIAIAAAGGGTLSSLILFDSTLGGDAASIDTGAGGIAQTAASLLVMILARTSEATTISTVNVTVNNDTGSNYEREQLTVTNATVAGGNALAAANWSLGVDGDSQEAGAVTLLSILIHGYTQTTFHKSGLALHNVPDDTAANNRIQFDGLRWKSTAAISRMKVAAGSGNLRAGSRMTVYGLL